MNLECLPMTQQIEEVLLTMTGTVDNSILKYDKKGLKKKIKVSRVARRETGF